jgi:hypothetical protein
LSYTQLLRGETAAQLFLVGDGSVRNEPQNLPVAKCFAGIHAALKICTHLYIYTDMLYGSQCDI